MVLALEAVVICACLAMLLIKQVKISYKNAFKHEHVPILPTIKNKWIMINEMLAILQCFAYVKSLMI